mmetsp:Transcript_9253/g.17981  ORF Transcript_9253/g.17981 Transcript_9253/m.17981 type:complete len:200 (+) Transcript_9253:496-1095(+)
MDPTVVLYRRSSDETSREIDSPDSSSSSLNVTLLVRVGALIVEGPISAGTIAEGLIAEGLNVEGFVGLKAVGLIAEGLIIDGSIKEGLNPEGFTTLSGEKFSSSTLGHILAPVSLSIPTFSSTVLGKYLAENPPRMSFMFLSEGFSGCDVRQSGQAVRFSISPFQRQNQQNSCPHESETGVLQGSRQMAQSCAPGFATS